MKTRNLSTFSCLLFRILLKYKRLLKTENYAEITSSISNSIKRSNKEKLKETEFQTVVIKILGYELIDAGCTNCLE